MGAAWGNWKKSSGVSYEGKIPVELNGKCRPTERVVRPS